MITAIACYSKNMKTEIEVKFLDIDHDDIRGKLAAIGASLEIPMRLMRRVTIDTSAMKQKGAYVRVRDEGNKVTMTYKQFDKLSVDGAKEIEIEVSHFQDTIDLLAATGLIQGSYQETKRETWKLGSTEIVLDEWPWLKPYIEIEGESEETLRDVAAQLGLDWETAAFGDVMVAYRAEYPHLTEDQTVGNVAEARFGDELPELLKPRN
jgi:adenylate cyclase class 2